MSENIKNGKAIYLQPSSGTGLRQDSRGVSCSPTEIDWTKSDAESTNAWTRNSLKIPNWKRARSACMKLNFEDKRAKKISCKMSCRRSHIFPNLILFPKSFCVVTFILYLEIEVELNYTPNYFRQYFLYHLNILFIVSTYSEFCPYFFFSGLSTVANSSNKAAGAALKKGTEICNWGQVSEL